jgi:hypothetical protein
MVGHKWRFEQGFWNKIRSPEVIGRELRSIIRVLLACADLGHKGYTVVATESAQNRVWLTVTSI